jgi:Cu/Ag efflux protein CusF
MRRALVSICSIAACLICVSTPSSAQEIIHALTGTVSAIDASTKTITVLQDSGSQGTFQALTNPKTRIAFDKKIEAETTAAGSFDKKGAYAIIFYFGADDNRTVVAVKSLGAGPFSSTTGTVTKFDPHAHSLTVQDTAGAEQIFRIDAQTIAETGMGAVEGPKFDVHNGDHVRVVSSQVNGAATVLFVRAL